MMNDGLERVRDDMTMNDEIADTVVDEDGVAVVEDELRNEMRMGS